MTVEVLSREARELLSRPLAAVIKIAYPLVVGLPLLTSSAPPFYAAMALTMLAALLGGLGTAAVFARERSSGLQLRYRLLPVPAAVLVRDRVIAMALIDAVQLLPVLALIALRHPDRATWWAPLLLALLGTLVAVDALGALASSFADSPGEVMLYVLIPLLPAFYLAGLFVPMTGGAAGLAATLLPFSHLHAALEGALGSAGGSPAAAAAGGVAWLLLGALLAAASGRRVLEAE